MPNGAVDAFDQMEFSDADFRIVDNADQSKKAAFQLSGLTTGTQRTYTAPDASGTLALTSNLASDFTGDSGSGGVHGLVPAPAAGDAAAGKFLKADGTWAVPSSGWTLVLKSSDQAKTNDTSLAADADLQFSMAASTSYNIRLSVFYEQASSVPDFKYSCTGPASPTLVRGVSHGFPSGGTEAGTLLSGYPGSTALDGGVGAGWLSIELAVQNGTNAGTFAFNWAQNTSNGNAVTVRKGSVLEYKSV